MLLLVTVDCYCSLLSLSVAVVRCSLFVVRCLLLFVVVCCTLLFIGVADFARRRWPLASLVVSFVVGVVVCR